jgi:hypothetical protein
MRPRIPLAGPNGRRLRDRLIEREGTRNPQLRGQALNQLLLFVDDDLRESALALGGIEQWLKRALLLLERADLAPGDLSQLAWDAELDDDVDQLAATLEGLRRRLGQLAHAVARTRSPG